MTSIETLSEKDDDPANQRYLQRSCCLKRARKNEETRSPSDYESESDSEPERDHSSDEDFSLKGPKKKRKKVKKLEKIKSERRASRKTSTRKAPQAPSFEQVIKAQIDHAYRFADFEEYESENSSITEPETTRKAPERRPQTPEPPKERKKRVIIYPWCPIGITGGRRLQ